ncbi:unnamed protein product [Diamesa hyperborea]
MSIQITIPEVSNFGTTVFKNEGKSNTFHITAGKLYRLNVGDKIFMAKLQTIGQKQYIFDKIAAYKYDGSLSVDSQIEFIIECDPKMFRHIHNYIRFGKLLLPTDFHEHKLLIEEAKSFGMNSLVEEIQSSWETS